MLQCNLVVLEVSEEAEGSSLSVDDMIVSCRDVVVEAGMSQLVEAGRMQLAEAGRM